jgi:tripartite-type tricarboxylate transporter receptor subunit TctC
VIAANASRPYRNFADIIAASKKEPGSIKYASVGIGTLGHLAMTMLAKKAGVEITHVPYRGGGPAMNDVLGGHVDLIAGSAALVTAQLGTNMLRPILQLGRERMASLPDTQTAIKPASLISRRWPGGAFSPPRAWLPNSSAAWRLRSARF